MVVDDVGVVVGAKNGVGADPTGVAPGDAGLADVEVRGNIGEGTVGVLTVLVESDQVAVEEGLNVEIVGGGGDEKFHVARPTHSFIALRTIGGDLQVVAFLAPDDVAVKMIDQRTGTGESAGRLDVGMDHDARD